MFKLIALKPTPRMFTRFGLINSAMMRFVSASVFVSEKTLFAGTFAATL